MRALARDLGEAVGSAAYLGALTRTASGPFRIEDAVAARRRPRGRRPTGPTGLVAAPAPDRRRPRGVPRGRPDRRGGRGRRAWPVRRRRPRASRRRRALPAARRRRRARRHRHATRARGSRPTRCSSTPPRPPAPSTPRRLTPMRVVAGHRRAWRRDDGPVFVVVGVFDGLHLGHQYLLRASRRARPRPRDARPTVITFDHHPDEVLTGHAPPLLIDPDERLERLADGRRGGHRRPALRRGAAPDAVRRLRRADPRAGGARRLPHDARCRVRLRAPRHAGGARRRSGRATASRSWSCRRSPSTGGRSAARRSARRSRPATSTTPRRSSAARHADRDARRDRALTFELPMALPPTGRTLAGSATRPVDDRASSDGAVPSWPAPTVTGPRDAWS